MARDWTEDRFTDTLDQFILRREVLNYFEASQDVTVEDTLGVDDAQTGSTGIDTSGNHSFVIAAVAPYDCRVTRVRAWLTQDGLGGAGTQDARAVVYGTSGGALAPNGPLLTSSGATTLTSDDSGSTLGPIEFTVPASASEITEGSTFWFGLQFGLGGTTNQAFTIPASPAAASTTVENTDTFSDGANSTFGSLIAGFNRLASFQCVIEEVIPDYATDIAALQAEVDALQATVAGLETEIGTGVSTSETLVETTQLLGASDTYYGEPLDCTAGKLVVWRALSSHAAANPGMQVDESVTGTGSWVPVIRPDGYSATESNGSGSFTGRVTANSLRYLRLAYFNAGTQQTAFEVVRTVA